MFSRRGFLSTLAAGLTVSAVKPTWSLAADAPEIESSRDGPVGLRLWSLREYGPRGPAVHPAERRVPFERRALSAEVLNR